MEFTKYEDRAVIKLIDSYSISSANFISRAKGMFSGKSSVKNHKRTTGKYSPMGTTKQTYIWDVNLKSVILDYEKISK